MENPAQEKFVPNPRTSAKMNPRRFRSKGLFRAYKHGAEGQSRTHTESPLTVFEFATVRTNRFFSPVNPANHAWLYGYVFWSNRALRNLVCVWSIKSLPEHRLRDFRLPTAAAVNRP